MSINTNNFAEPTYKGVSLGRVISYSASHKKKLSTHEFPNRDRAYVEELGLSALSISIQGEIYVPQNNKAILDLTKIATEEGSGELILEREKFINMVCGGIDINPSLITAIGMQPYTITFIQTEPTITSTNNDVNVGYVERLKNRVFTQNKTAFINKKAALLAKYPTLSKNIAATKDALASIPKISSEMLSLAKTVQGSASGFSEFTNTLNVFVANAGTLINSPSVLAESIGFSMASLETAFDGALALFGVSKSMTSFQVNTDAYYGTSSTKDIIDTNRNLINDNIVTTALAQCYFASVNIDYESVQDLEDNRIFLESVYESLDIERLDEDLYQTLNELRVIANKTLDNIALQLPSIATYDITQRPLARFVYGLYGNLDNLDLTDTLNNAKDVSMLSGEVLALV